MDPVRARAMTEELRGQTLGGWTVKELAGLGKSAVVLEATRGNEVAALKVFDRELVEKYGRDIQLRRLNREMKLIGREHHLVRVRGGGEEPGFQVL